VGDRQHTRVAVPFDSQGIGQGCKLLRRKAEIELSMTKTITFEEDNFEFVTGTTYAGNEVSRGTPAECAFKPIDRFTHTVQLSFS
jgi:hypothetical protein